MNIEVVEQKTASELASEYLQYRDLRAKLKQVYESKDAVLSAEMDAVTQQLMMLCNEQDASSIRTEAGTIIRSTDTQYATNDWDSMHSFILQNNAPYLLQKRINKSAMAEFLEQNPDQFPKGMNIVTEYKISVRRPTKKS
jgi:hypothetical protein